MSETEKGCGMFRKPRCETCNHFDPDHPSEGFGWCRRFPPQPMPYWPVDEGLAEKYHGPSVRWNQPVVHKSETCGEYFDYVEPQGGKEPPGIP
jgi:hypothetical protein